MASLGTINVRASWFARAAIVTLWYREGVSKMILFTPVGWALVLLVGLLLFLAALLYTHSSYF